MNLLHDLKYKSKHLIYKFNPGKGSYQNSVGHICTFKSISKRPGEIVVEVARLNDLLDKVCRVGNEYFAYQIFTVVSTGFMTILFNCYYILDVFIQITKNISRDENSFIWYFSIQAVFYLVEILILVEMSTKLIDEVILSVR